ncbi:MAG: imidazoleglycerol-phosphate dehydratase HisB [Mogibacterium sp.]|nr:imidazoleglycerol-phosphate dehydratase HisB [Mogibacterium sp.]
MRNAEISRKTAETDIELWLELDGSGRSEIDTGVGFLDHMLTLLAKHGGFDLVVRCDGDTYVDDHHSVEDIGITLGRAFAEAIGDKRGIRRYGNTILPMDEALILTAVDISGRSYLGFELEIPTEKVGTFDTELVEEFFLGFVRTAGITLHIRQMAGKNTHHIIEGTFKSFARTMRNAVAIDERFRDEIPSTKGTLREEENEIDLYAQEEAAEDAPFRVTEEPIYATVPEPPEPPAPSIPATPSRPAPQTRPAPPPAPFYPPDEDENEDWFDGEPGPDPEPEFEPEPAPARRVKDDTFTFDIPDEEDDEEEPKESSHVYRRYDTFDYSDYDGASDSESDLDALAESMARDSLRKKTQIAMNWNESSDSGETRERRATGLDGTLVNKSRNPGSKGLDDDYVRGIVRDGGSTEQLEKELIEKGLL